MNGSRLPIDKVPLLLDAFAMVSRQRPQTRLILVGDGCTMHAVRSRAVSADLREADRFEGWRQDLVAVPAPSMPGVLTSLNKGTLSS